MNGVAELLEALYPADGARTCQRGVEAAIQATRGSMPGGRAGFDQRDAVLITYPDMVRQEGTSPLRALRELCETWVSGLVSTVHLLPFFPSSSDDGFSVVDYRSVDPEVGSWEDIEAFASRFRLMVDAVFNHVSAHSAWFQAFLRDESEAGAFFLVVPEGTDLSQVTRPRSLPLLTPVETPSGRKLVWTTFSADQVDLNYANPRVLVEMVETLLYYARRGAGLIRLDAIGYIWKEVGTRCIHLPQAHRIVQLFRAVLDAAAPHVALVTETNVPHEENVSYFGDGYHEAQVVYNFSLPPLVLHAFLTGSAVHLQAWASRLRTPSDRTTFLNFLASHDGIGVTPARGILADDDLHLLVDAVRARGGRVSTRRMSDGTDLPYELNISYWDALADPGGGEPLEVQVQRFLAAHAILLSLPGVPALYFHSLFGSVGWPEGVLQTGQARAINREKLRKGRLLEELEDPGSRRGRVFAGLRRLLEARRACPSFHPHAGARVLEVDHGVFALLRFEREGSGERVLCLHNVGAGEREVEIVPAEVPGAAVRSLEDLLTGTVHAWQRTWKTRLKPFQVSWFRLRA